MDSQLLTLGPCCFEVLTEGQTLTGIGKVWIGETLVRSGRLPIRPYSQSFVGAEMGELTLLDITRGTEEVRIRFRAAFKPLEVKLMKDRSIDPIHEKGDWDAPASSGSGEFTLVLRPASYAVEGMEFSGFSYHYEYTSGEIPLFYLLDKASWELEGDITGATLYNQSACSAPVVTFADDTFWTSEGELFFLDQASHFNRVMTHNLPRWASHQAFDFQCKGAHTLLGIFDHVDLIRSLLLREPGKAELKTFDKHIFDETLSYATAPKAILLNSAPKTPTLQQNLWTWIFDDVHARARAEFGLKEQPPIPFIGHHHWSNFTIDTYYKDIVPAMANLGFKAIFAENFKKSDASEVGLPMGNMCCSQEYEIAEHLGGTAKFKEYIERCHRYGIKNYMWTNTYVSTMAKMNPEHRCESNSWYCAMEDTRTKYAGAYTCVSSNLDFKNPEARRYYIDAHKKIIADTGLDGYFIDSYYNLFFMPVDYKTGHPRTMWREALQVMKELEDAGAGFYIESFGPFGQPQHGHPSSYHPGVAFICYYVGVGNDYTTVPIPGSTTEQNSAQDPAFLFYLFAHKAPYMPSLFIDGQRVDEVYGQLHRRVIADYHRLLPAMHRRYLQEDGQGVLYHDEAGAQATLWNFVARRATLPGTVHDLTTGEALPAAESYALQPLHCYGITGCTLPVTVANHRDTETQGLHRGERELAVSSEE